MAINLLGYVAPQSATALTNAAPKVQTSTPSVTPYAQVGGAGIPAGQTSKTVVPLGVNATSPYSNLSAPSGALPAAQVAKTPAPVDTSSFTPAQLAAFNQAASLGSGVQTQNGIVGGAGSTGNIPPPTTATAASSPYNYDANGNLIPNPNAAPGTAGSASSATQTTTTPSTSPTMAPTASQPYSATNPVTQGGLLAQAANIASQPSADYTAQQAQANAYNQQLQQSYANEAQAEANIQGAPHTLNFAQGAENVIRDQALTQQQGLATAYQGASGLLVAANTQQQNEASGLTTAANSAAPIQVSPGNYLASPLTGVASNAAAGQAQGIQSATNWAIAQQNNAQGANYQGVAQDLSNAIQTMQPIGQKLTDFITSTGQNPATSPLVNQQISTINAQLYPAQVATLNAAINDIRSYAIQILGSQSGANPTDVTNAVNSFNFSNFSAADLQSFLGDLNNLGNTRLSQAQSAANSSYGANATVGTPAEGITATDQGAFNTGTMTPSSVDSNLGKALLGTLASTASAAAGAVSNAVSSAAGGVIGGAAEAYFTSP